MGLLSARGRGSTSVAACGCSSFVRFAIATKLFREFMNKATMSEGRQCTSIKQIKDNEEINQEVPQNYVHQKYIPKSPKIHLESTSDTNWKDRAPSPKTLPTSKASQEVNWQASMTTIRARNAVMFNNPLMSDVRFIVGTTSVWAHKYVLATASSVFFAMFYGALADQTNSNEIHVTDIQPDAFLNLLRYIYCDEIQLDADNVWSTLYAAKKYLVPYLTKACVQYMGTTLSARNACVSLSHGLFFEEEELTQRCWEVIDAQAEEALKSESFCEIDHSTLQSVLARDTLNVKELSIFNAACKWAEAECLRQDLQATPENKRAVLKSAMYHIRLPAMSLEDFANGPAQSGIITLKETTDIFLHFTAHSKPILPFIHNQRTGLQPQKCRRFQSSAYRSNQWRYRGRCDSIQFSVDRRIFIVGFGLYGSSNGAAEYQVKIELKKNGNILGQNQTSFFSDGSSSTFSVMFEKPISVEADTFYTASAILDGAELSYFGQEGMAECQCGKVTFQFQCSSDSTNGTGVQGGQIPEIIFY
ncbi:BTB/POZ domain-containing protein 6-B isoform X1 [Octopus bimaculoides]|uniref:BTB domain-containing protein n=1 Tax=Octopus bimaculoides TaxID=37653 RepID=A0A0L8G168_OCTBM|nr:BTB/POZ domain-containing protein 6-B isoform X1 [Octopus bimaculoides]|eukprot:XP_014785107.1 PREDICTED: BTB/POZ domain-containing protein 6-B-like isoform X1 [Octopus bimaculoides]